ncbi:4-hydroxy-tetrahydrodipicolinate synthase [Sodalis praecaptivus]
MFVIRQLEYCNFIANTWISDAAIYQDGDNPIDFLFGVLRDRHWLNSRIGIDKRGWFLPIAVYEALQAKLGTIYDGTGVIEQLRAVKSAAELEKMGHAARYVDAGMRAGLEAIAAGADENALVAAMMGQAIAAGSEYVGMEPLVSSGTRNGVPHGTWRRRKIQPGDPVFLEMAAAHDRYHAALMHSAWLGKPPAAALEMEKVCQEALQAALDAIRPGATCEAPHIACQQVIDLGGLPMVTPPFVSEVTDAQIVSFFKRMAPLSHTGILVYNAPGIGITLAPPILEQLADIPQVVGIKQGDLNPTAIDQIANRLGGRLRLFCASDLAFLGPMMCGFDGISTTNSGALPELVLATFRALESGDATTARDLHRLWYDFRALARRHGQPQLVKAAMNLRGFNGGHVRLPLVDVGPEVIEQTRAVLQSLAADARSGVTLAQ